MIERYIDRFRLTEPVDNGVFCPYTLRPQRRGKKHISGGGRMALQEWIQQNCQENGIEDALQSKSEGGKG